MFVLHAAIEKFVGVRLDLGQVELVASAVCAEADKRIEKKSCYLQRRYLVPNSSVGASSSAASASPAFAFAPLMGDAQRSESPGGTLVPAGPSIAERLEK